MKIFNKLVCLTQNIPVPEKLNILHKLHNIASSVLPSKFGPGKTEGERERERELCVGQTEYLGRFSHLPDRENESSQQTSQVSQITGSPTQEEAPASFLKYVRPFSGHKSLKS